MLFSRELPARGTSVQLRGRDGYMQNNKLRLAFR